MGGRKIKQKNIIQSVIRGLLVLAVANAVFLVFMTVCYCIPTEGRMKTNVGNSLYTWEDEDISPIFDDPKAYWADFYSDLIWVNMAVTKEGTPLHDAVVLPWKVNDAEGDDQTYQYLIQALYYPDDETTGTVDYSRYWMLTVGILKILFCFLEIRQIRYLYWVVAASLMLLVFYYTNREAGIRASIALFIAMLMRNWLLHTASISTGADILVTLLGMLNVLLLHHYRADKCNRWIPAVFILDGSLSFALGPLVAPVLTIVMPLLLEILLDKSSGKTTWLHVVRLSICWVAGYAGSMLFKSILAMAVEGSQTASSTAMYYLGPGQGVLPRIGRILYCFHGLMKPMTIKLPYVVCILLALLIVARRRGVRRCANLGPLLFVSCYPLFWTFIVVEHSKHYFAANSYSGLVFGLLCIALYSIGDKKHSALTSVTRN